MSLPVPTTPTIDLAPRHKLGFMTTSPILLAAGIVGMGDTVLPAMDLPQLGGVVVGPIRRRAHAGSSPPRLAEAPGLIALDVGLQNRGLAAILKRYTRYWSRLGTPVIVQLADSEPRALGAVAEQLSLLDEVTALELAFPTHLPEEIAPHRWLEQALRLLNERSDLPIWVKLPLGDVRHLGQCAVDHGAVGLVVGQPPTGILPRAISDGADEGKPALVRGALYGPAVFPLMLTALADLGQLRLPAALIACGGIHTVAQARQALAMGASALQIDSAAWIEPGLPLRLHQALREEVELLRRGTTVE